MSDSLLLLVFMVPGTFFLGLCDVYTRKVLREGIQEGFLIGMVFVPAGALLLLLSLAFGLPALTSDFWYAFGITAGLNIISQLMWFKALRREHVSLISPITLLTPPFVLFTGFLFLGEEPSIAGIFGVFVTVAGLLLLLVQEAAFRREHFIKIVSRPGVLFALGAVLFFALSFPFDKRALLTSSPLFFAGLISLVVGIFNLVFHIVLSREISISWSTFKKIPFRDTLLLAVFFISGSFLTIYALKFSLAAYAASVKRLWPLWAVLLSGGILAEKNIAKKLIAVSLMLAGIFLSVFFG